LDLNRRIQLKRKGVGAFVPNACWLGFVLAARSTALSLTRWRDGRGFDARYFAPSAIPDGIVFGEADPPAAKAMGLRYFQLFVHFRERINREFQVFVRMRGGHLRADARGAVWNDRIKEANHVNAFLQHARSELL